jgi:hypothetical protein
MLVVKYIRIKILSTNQTNKKHTNYTEFSKKIYWSIKILFIYATIKIEVFSFLWQKLDVKGIFCLGPSSLALEGMREL